MKNALVILFFAVLISACGSKEDKKDKGKDEKQKPKASTNAIIFSPEQIKNGGIDTGRIPFHLLSSTIHVNGQVDVPPQNLISVNVPLGGFLKRTTMLPGQAVKRGQAIAEIENQEYITIQQDYLTSVSKITYLKQELERQRILSQQQASPLKLYQQSLSDYNSEVAQAAGLAEKLKLLGINPHSLRSGNIRSIIVLRSPITGYVAKVNVNTGRFINSTDVLMELVNTEDIHAALTVFEKDIDKIAIGNYVKITLPSLPGKLYPGKVILIGRMLDTSHSVMVHCHFLKTDANLLPNMFLQATIQSKPNNTLALPDGAIIDYGGKKYAFVADKKGKGLQFSMTPIDIGVQENGWNEVHLKNADVKNKMFVTKGAFEVLSALKNTGEDN